MFKNLIYDLNRILEIDPAARNKLEVFFTISIRSCSYSL